MRLAIVALLAGCVAESADPEPDAGVPLEVDRADEIDWDRVPWSPPADCETADLCTDPAPERCVIPGTCAVFVCAEGGRHVCHEL